MKTPRWLTLEEVIVYQELLIVRYGGSAGILNSASLEAALMRPKNLFHYENETDLAKLAASYGFSLATKHPFQDGNKRVSALVTYVFLADNGLELEAPEEELAAVFESLASKKLSEQNLAEWISAHVRKQRPK